MRRNHFFSTLTVLALLVGLVVITAPATALASGDPLHHPAPPATHHLHTYTPGCSGTGCNWTNPYTEHCNTGNYYVLYSAPLTNVATGQSSWNYGYVQLWWSDTCQTNWTYTTVYVTGINEVNSLVNINTNPIEAASDNYSYRGPGTSYPSAQLYAPNNLACSQATLLNGTIKYTAVTGQYTSC